MLEEMEEPKNHHFKIINRIKDSGKDPQWILKLDNELRWGKGYSLDLTVSLYRLFINYKGKNIYLYNRKIWYSPP